MDVEIVIHDHQHLPELTAQALAQMANDCIALLCISLNCIVLYRIVTQTFVTLPPKQKNSDLFPKYLAIFLNAQKMIFKCDALGKL